jgi:CRP-like cAMP-binding protein
MAGDVVADVGTIAQTLSIVSDGVLVEIQDHEGKEEERQRLTPGSYFGEAGLLMGRPQRGSIRALTPAVIYEIPRDAFCQVLAQRPSVAEDFSEALARLQFVDQPIVNGQGVAESHNPRLVQRILEGIRHLFALH